jgi:transketolase
MLNPELKLNQNLFPSAGSDGSDGGPKLEQAAIREGLGKGLLAAAEKDDRIVGLCADLTESTKMLAFKEKFPNRFIEIGVAEQNMASVASGVAAMGKIPVITSYAMFSPGRNWEQIRTTICYNGQKVVIAGSHAGVSVGPDGGSHQALEDIALTRVIPNMTVFSPCDAIEARRITELALTDTIRTPTYIRLAREKTPVITTEETSFGIVDPANPMGPGSALKAHVFFIPNPELKKSKAEIGIIATGSLVYNALCAANELEKEGIAVKVLRVHSIKPLDTDAVVALAEECGAIVTVEEHQIAGGFGSAIAECLASRMNRPVPIEFIGMHDHFGQSGTPLELVSFYKMDAPAIKDAAHKVMARKG